MDKVTMKNEKKQQENDEAPPTEDAKNRGWPKGKKRYPKLPGAPKQPLSGYVHFLNDRRDSLRKECPEISFAEISKKLATEWSQLAPDTKQKYMDIAEQDKERFNKEFAAYQLTEDYKKYVEAQNKSREDGNKEPAKKKAKKENKAASAKDKTNSAPPAALINDDSNEAKEDPSGLDFPIFTSDFLEYNKAREAELRQLRKQVAEMEEQNDVLLKHVENMTSAIGKLEAETKQQQDNSTLLTKHMESLRRLVVNGFQDVTLPGRTEAVTMDNVDEFIDLLHQRLAAKPNSQPSDDPLVLKAREIVAKMDYQSLSKPF